MSWQKFGHPNPACACNCPTGVFTPCCPSMPTTLYATLNVGQNYPSGTQAFQTFPLAYTTGAPVTVAAGFTTTTVSTYWASGCTDQSGLILCYAAPPYCYSRWIFWCPPDSRSWSIALLRFHAAADCAAAGSSGTYSQQSGTTPVLYSCSPFHYSDGGGQTVTA